MTYFVVVIIGKRLSLLIAKYFPTIATRRSFTFPEKGGLILDFLTPNGCYLMNIIL
nr:MAG TPA: hypothetical protein [Caudoviricetes sp.]